MKLLNSLFLPLIIGALVSEVVFAEDPSTCNTTTHHKKHPHKSHRHKHHHKHHRHHHKHHHQDNSNNNTDNQSSGGDSRVDAKNNSNQQADWEGTVGVGSSSSSDDNSYESTSSTSISVGHHKSSHNDHHQSSNGGRKGACAFKAGIAGTQALELLRDVICWAHDWEVKPYKGNKMEGVMFVSTVYGIGMTGRAQDKEAWEAFQQLPAGTYDAAAGYNEADFSGRASAGRIPPKVAAEKWDQVMRAHRDKGVFLISPSCAKQLDEDWMGPFLDAVEVKPDAVNIHVFSDDAEFILKVLDHYRQFGLNMVVTEFACINFSKNKKCNQEETIRFIYRAVEIFESAPDVLMYSIADADNGDASHLTVDGQGKKLTQTGWAYKDAISKHSKQKRDKIYVKRR